jgi:serine/threonine protein kinase
MTPELWQRLKPLFYAALDRPIEERMAYIDEVCADDGELKAHLVQLIQAAQEETATPDRPLVRLFQPRTARFSPGEIILERFRIVRPIGSGGMGEVYEAEDMQLGRVALKTIRDHIASSPGVFGRFRHEVQLARKVSGAQVCRIHELYLLPASGSHGATAFLTMEYLEGVTLAEKVKRDGPFPLKEALRVALDICEGLKLVHGNGVIHRDLKSANIMLCGEGDSLRAVLMDFGLARDFSASVSSEGGIADADRDAGTVAGAIMGTPAYMAPEQFESKPVSPATDIYALGIVLYELVTGIHPYAAPTPVAAAIRRAHRPAPPSLLIRSVPRKWDRIIQRCLQYEPTDRFQSAEEVAKALKASPADLDNLRKDRPWLFAVACGLVLAVLAWGAFIEWQKLHYYNAAPEALRQYNDGLSLIRQGNYAEATNLLQTALKSDPNFVMAHARLAEAWYNLDFQGSAQQELLIALPERRRLPSLDAAYLDAIHATVTGKSSAALEDYKRILDDLPRSEKSSGYVDLGMAYERAGDIAHSLESYAKAAQQDSKNPAAYMHTGILQSRLHHVKEGKEAFDQGQTIFANERDEYGRLGNPEGLAELNYERGYAANESGDSRNAVSLLEKASDEAEKIPSVQLEIRALCQLSSAESADYKDEEAVAHAMQAIQLARDYQLEPWAASGLVRLANAQLAQLHFKETEEPLNEAMQILKASPQPRIQALANVTFASLMQQEGHPDKVAEPARAALDYYKRNGFSEGAFKAALLLVRDERNKGQYKQALDDGNTLLAVANQRGSAGLKVQAEEAVGTVYLAIEQYPDALKHFENARALASNESQRSYQELHCGEALWKLGRYPESEAMFKMASGNSLQVARVGKRQVDSLLSQQKYRDAFEQANILSSSDRNVPVDLAREIQQDLAVAEAHLGMKQQALATLHALDTPDQATAQPESVANDHLMAAEVYLALKMNPEAYSSAAIAQEYFASSGQPDSQLQSAFLALRASEAIKDETNYQIYLKKIVDILGHLRQTWGPDSLKTFLSRPDFRNIPQSDTIHRN